MTRLEAVLEVLILERPEVHFQIHLRLIQTLTDLAAHLLLGLSFVPLETVGDFRTETVFRARGELVLAVL